MNESLSQQNRVEALAQEFLERRRQGERPTIAEYAARYPELAEEIRACFPALLLVEDLKPDPAEATGPSGAPDVLGGGSAVERLGDYRILREVGRGGMGVVYEAEQEALGRHVALKVLPAQALLDPKHLQRFEREARAAARLHHTNIVPVFGVGADDGLYYYVMQFIQGLGLDQVLDELQRLRTLRNGAAAEAHPPARSGGTQPVAAAQMAEALLTGRFSLAPNGAPPGPEEAAPRSASLAVAPSASDSSAAVHLPGQAEHTTLSESGRGYWQGVARIGVQVAEALAHAHGQGILHRDIKPSNLLLDTHGTVWVTDFGLAKASDSDGLTQTGDIVGTLRYMAPERFQGQSDPRSDLYGLGITLYELLTLRPAFDAADRNKLLQRVMQEEPPRPRKLNPEVPRDLETIVLKAIAKEPKLRYASAGAMAEDLRRFLADRPIWARRSSPWEQTWRWCRRNPAVASLIGFAALLLVAVAAVSTGAAFRLDRGLQQTADAERQARLREADALVGQAHGTRLSRRIGQRFATLDALGKAVAIGRELDQPPAWFDPLRNEAIACLALPDLRVAKEWNGWPEGTINVDFDGTLERYARLDGSGNVSVRRVAGDDEIYRLPGMGSGPATCHFRDDGQFLAVWKWRNEQGEDLGRLQVWKLTGPEPRLVLEEPRGVFDAIGFLPDGQELVVGHIDGSLSRYDLASGKRAERLRLSLPPLVLAVHPREMKLAIACLTSVQIFDLEAGKAVAEFRYPEVRHACVAWDPGGKVVAAVGGDAAIYLWDVATGKQLARLPGYRRDNAIITFNHAGDLLVSADGGGFLRLWGPWTDLQPQQEFSVQFHSASLRFSADDRLLAGGFDGHKLRLWAVAPACGYRTLVRDPVLGGGGYRGCATSPRHRLLAVGMTDGVGLWDLSSGRPLQFLPIGYSRYPVFEASGALLTNGPGGLLRFPIQADPAAPGALRVGAAQKLPLPGSEPQMATSRDGRVVASAQGWGGLVWRQDVAGAPLRLPQKDTRFIAVSPDGRWVATGSFGDSPEVQVWQVQSGKLVAALPVEGGTRVVFSPDGRWLATGGLITRLWEVGPWRERQRFPAVVRTPVAFSADGTFAFETGNGAVRLVAPDSGRELAQLEDPRQDHADELAFSADGTQLVTNGEGNSLHVWDLRVIREQLAERGLDWGPASPPAGEPQAVPPLQLTLEADVLVPCPYANPADWAKAIADCAEDIRLDPASVTAHNSLAWLLATSPDPQWRDPVRAIGLARRAIELEPKDGLFRNTLGVAQYRAGDWNAALASLRQALELRQGGDSFTWFFLAMTHWQRGEKRDACYCYNRAVQWMEKNEAALAKDPSYGEQLGRFRAEAVGLLGVQAQWGFWEAKAVADCTEAIRLHPQDVSAWVNRGDVYALRGDWDKAVADYAAAVRLGPDDHILRYDLAVLHLQAGDTGAYRQDCEVMLRRFGQTRDPLVAHCVALICLVRPDAVTDRQQVLLLAERGAAGAPREAWYLLMLGAAHYRAGQFPQAIRRLEQALVVPRADYYTSILTQLLLAMAHHSAGHAAEARQWLDKAIQRSDKALPRAESRALGPNWNAWSMCRCLRQEAEALVQERAADQGK
jgi:serine/threonine protein kinase/WD40 repeat protein/tetratricopeptide (TPR) repeat protein